MVQMEKRIPPDFSTAKGIETWLLSIPKFSDAGVAAANFNLERMARFCEVLGNPQLQYKTIHVAGTNGKGTVCRMLASVYQSAGYRTGLYTSPHLIDLNERFRLNSESMESSMLPQFFDLAGDHILSFNYTFFELTTAIAFWYFRKMNADVAVIETGLGGRLDATNVIDPELSVVTSISLDHTDVLGNTIELISAEKAGIIKNKKPVITGILPPEAEEVIKKVAEKNSSPFFTITDSSFDRSDACIETDVQSIKNALGKNTTQINYQNALLAAKSLKLLQSSLPLEKEAIADGFRKLDSRFPSTAAFERLSQHQRWFFDGAHNPAATEAVIRQMQRLTDLEEWTVILSFMSDKLNHSLAEKWQAFDQVWLWPMASERAAGEAEMLSYFPNGKILNRTQKELLAEIDTKLVIFSGSLYFYSIVREWIHSISAS
ncbi:MAG: bifunctional folylpolyglutamate synthase/dihydrofolate synthase [Balneolaceae bacterium]|nr:MAG: bifunctional folylpolyglutamate synthase/dihydrofolate synthase [Balneolaceae bacterium]